MTTAHAKFTNRQPASDAEMITRAIVEDLNHGLSQREVAAEDVMSVLFISAIASAMRRASSACSIAPAIEATCTDGAGLIPKNIGSRQLFCANQRPTENLRPLSSQGFCNVTRCGRGAIRQVRVLAV